MSRGPPTPWRRRRGGRHASREVVKGTRFGNEDTTDDRLDHGFALLDERTTGYASDDAGRRARALAVHCAIRLPNETLSGSSASTSLRRLKNSRVRALPVSNRRLMFREPRDDEDARRERRAAAKARWDRLRRTGVAVTNMSSRPIRGVGRAEVAVTGSGALSALPPPPPPPPLVDLFGGDEAAAEAFREEKFMRDVKDAEDDIEFPDDDDDGRCCRRARRLARTKNVTSHARVGRTTHWTRCSRSPRSRSTRRSRTSGCCRARPWNAWPSSPTRTRDAARTEISRYDRTVRRSYGLRRDPRRERGPSRAPRAATRRGEREKRRLGLEAFEGESRASRRNPRRCAHRRGRGLKQRRAFRRRKTPRPGGGKRNEKKKKRVYVFPRRVSRPFERTATRT